MLFLIQVDYGYNTYSHNRMPVYVKSNFDSNPLPAEERNNH